MNHLKRIINHPTFSLPPMQTYPKSLICLKCSGKNSAEIFPYKKCDLPWSSKGSTNIIFTKAMQKKLPHDINITVHKKNSNPHAF